MEACEYLPHIGDCNVANTVSLNITEESAISIGSAAQDNTDLVDYHRFDLREEFIFKKAVLNGPFVCLGLPRKYLIPVYPFADNVPICCHCHVDTHSRTLHRGGTAASSRLKRARENHYMGET